jgi:hypothetical protein
MNSFGISSKRKKRAGEAVNAKDVHFFSITVMGLVDGERLYSRNASPECENQSSK